MKMTHEWIIFSLILLAIWLAIFLVIPSVRKRMIWASINNILAIPIAAGIVYPSYKIFLRPKISASLMSASKFARLD